MNHNQHLLYPAGWLAILCFAGVAWAQGGNLDRPGQEKPFLPPVSTESPYQSSTENPYQSLEASKGSASPKAKEINKKAAKPKNINKNRIGGRPKTDSHSPSLGQSGASQGKSSNPTLGAVESAPIGKSLSLPGGSTSTSFLDGYFLKSLHEERMARKKPSAGTDPKDNLQQKNHQRKARDHNLK